MVYQWRDKVVIITGAASGIGEIVVRYLMDESVKHVAVVDLDENKGKSLQHELNAKYGANKVQFYKGDVTNDDQLFSVFNSVKSKQGDIDVVINNAGILNESWESYKKQIDINVTAVVTSTLKALELMRKDHGGKGGTVINIASIAALIQTPLVPIYCATKSAVLQFSNCIGHKDYYKTTGVRVIAICPGVTNTSILSQQKLGSFDKNIENVMEKKLKEFPMQSPESAARGVIDAYKQGESGSTWLLNADKPAADITHAVTKAYQIMGEGIVQ
ncbi:15-hydroxyprostaglandin dehydrogenase [NAD(+)]-like [Hyposmocoma kahamanoa]|uniref:15-hydroxyprostaglandin dehydrogenase [NAD(+)]-like n=1 Tax=Hyposmocoma kahamanoa TaxID=1477025 RepID=UPI000E6D8E5A|nr:15-hydroxyprostaglandin dehydrogenase [NAD(+)]-like [Hyposmocoma kahamanoa]